MLLISSPRFGEHVTPPGHPERLERAEVFDRVAEDFARQGGDVREPAPIDDAALARVHTSDYLALVASVAGRAAMLDPDTFTSPESVEIARLAAGAAVQAARHTWTTGQAALALVRPPGHHAEPDKPMGFCLYNNIAVAAAALRAEGADRVAIVDIDVHHGNGTQAAFYADPSVLFVSSHQFPYYPGTGAAEERGIGAGEGYTLNIPLAAGARDDDYARAYDARVLPALARFRPQIVLISAGYDAHERDPLAGMRMTTDGFARLLTMLREASLTVSGRPPALVTEGGYHLTALRDCLEATIRVID